MSATNGASHAAGDESSNSKEVSLSQSRSSHSLSPEAGAEARTSVVEDSSSSASGEKELARSATMKSVISVYEPKIRRRQITWFTATYFSLGYTNALATLVGLYLSQRGVSEFMISLVQALGQLSLIFNIPCGLISDKYDFFGMGHRRPYVFIGLALTAIFFAAMGFQDLGSFSLPAFAVLWVLMMISREIFDKPQDAYIIETTAKSEAGRIQGKYKNGARAFGIIPGLIISAFLSDSGERGWAIVFFIASICIAVPALWTFSVPEPHAVSQFKWGSLEELKRPNVIAHVVYTLLSTIPGGALNLVAPLYLEDEGFTNLQIAIILVIGAIVLCIGAISMGHLIDRHRSRFVTLFLVVLFADNLAYLVFTGAAVVSGNKSSVWAVGGLWSALIGYTVGAGLSVNLALMMYEVQDSAIAASFFAVFNMAAGIGSFIGTLIGGALVGSIGYINTSIVVVVLAFVKVPLVYPIFKGQDYANLPVTEELKVSGDEIQLGENTKSVGVEVPELR